jgi:hypothetical protein
MSDYKLKNAPAFQLYPANELADARFRKMHLDERGLWISMCMECWVNGSVPSEVGELARWLGQSENDVKNALTERVISYFKLKNNDYINPDLEVYRAKILKSREGMSTGGKKGANRKRSKVSNKEINGQGYPSSHPDETLKATHKGLSIVSTSLDSFNTYHGDESIDGSSNGISEELSNDFS